MSRNSNTPPRRTRPFRPAWKAIKRAWQHLAPPADRGYMICTTPRSGTTGRTAKGIYAVKMHYFQIGALKQFLDPTRERQIRTADPIREAARYDQDQIRQSLIWLMGQRAKWEKKLQTLDARPLHLTYETIMHAPQLAVDRVAAFMRIGERPRIDLSHVSVTMQRDQTTEDWCARFLAETGDEFRHLADPVPDRRRLARPVESD
jgi:LPS sulfotransferase NodH